jgi:hypothetical protein
MKEKKEKVKKETKEEKANEKPHFVLEVQDSKISSKDIIGKGDK